MEQQLYESKKKAIETEYVNARNEIRQDQTNKIYLLTMVRQRIECNFKAAKTRYQQNILTTKTWFMKECDKLNVERLKSETEAADLLEIEKIRNDYSVSKEGLLERKNKMMDHACDDWADAQTVYATEKQKCYKQERDLKLQRETQLNRAKEIMHEKMVALAKEVG